MGLVGAGNQSSSNDKSNDKLTSTLKYAGIGIGAVAFLGLVFAVVRWRSNKKKRSRKMPDFADVDYGMSTTTGRSKSHRQQRQSEPRSSLGGEGGQSYPFSNRPAIAGAAAVGVGAGALAAGAATGDQDYYNDQYYDDGYAQHSKAGYDNYGNQNGGYDNYGYGQQGYDQGYDQQGYDQQGYYKEAGAAGGYEGYDQHGNYIGDQQGYYDQQGYDYSQQHQQDYQYPAATGVDASGSVVASGVGASTSAAMDGSAVAYPAEAAAVSPRRNGGAEMMSEKDFGNSAGAGYGRQY
ncbi:hypothetical protein BG015_006106 [Linnemannia schmuckeri]|uniref:Uncharacterized protein n=1 Tax=Linnemannia schmuckeri TaxID=64567 RepID=A0A9P5R2J9_9FUNG|nr:hypothetical protein BG015_006106 [Linnemannia schmuckeri]